MSDKDEQNAPSIDALLARVGREFSVAFEEVSLGCGPLSLLQIQDMAAYIDKLVARASQNADVRLPLWSKIWPSCMVMARMLQSLEPEGRNLLDIGAGVGLIGLAAAMRGFNATLADIEPMALDFSRIGALKNGLAHKVEVVKADFTRDDIGRRFDLVVGCEIFYRPKDLPGLSEFMDKHLEVKPEAEILLAMEKDRTPVETLRTMSGTFSIRCMETECKVDGEPKQVNLFRLRRKDR